MSVAGCVLMTLGAAESTCADDRLPWFGFCPFSRIVSTPPPERSPLQYEWMDVHASLDDVVADGSSFRDVLEEIGPVPGIEPTGENCGPVALGVSYPVALRRLELLYVAPSPSTCVRTFRMHAEDGYEQATYTLSCDQDCDGRRNTVEYRFKRVGDAVRRRSLRLERDPWYFDRPSAL